MRCSAHFSGSPEDLLLVQHGGGVDQHMAVVVADRGDKAGLALSAGLLHGVIEVVLCQRDFEAVEAFEADLLAETVDAGF